MNLPNLPPIPEMPNDEIIAEFHANINRDIIGMIMRAGRSLDANPNSQEWDVIVFSCKTHELKYAVVDVVHFLQTHSNLSENERFQIVQQQTINKMFEVGEVDADDKLVPILIMPYQAIARIDLREFHNVFASTMQMAFTEAAQYRQDVFEGKIKSN